MGLGCRYSFLILSSFIFVFNLTGMKTNNMNFNNKTKSSCWADRKKEFKRLGYWQNIKDEIKKSKEEFRTEYCRFFGKIAKQKRWCSGCLWTDDICCLANDMRKKIRSLLKQEAYPEVAALAYLLMFVTEMHMEDISVAIKCCNFWVKNGHKEYYLKESKDLKKSLKDWKIDFKKTKSFLNFSTREIAIGQPEQKKLILENVFAWLKGCVKTCMENDNKETDKYYKSFSS
jgi:hypothetical protein